MHTFQELKRAAKRTDETLPKVRMALAGDTATQLLATGLRGEAMLRGLHLELYEAAYNSVESELLQPTSALREHDAQYVVVYRSVHAFAARHAQASVVQQARMAEEELSLYETLLADSYFRERTLLIFNLPMLDDGIFGSLASSVAYSLPSQIRAFNYGLQRLAQQHTNVGIVDADGLQALLGREVLFDEAVYATTELEFSLSALPRVCARVINMVCVRRGSMHKVLVTDLDNTIWGGVVSEDGMGGLQIGHGLGIGRAYSDVQRWMRKLVQRGVILCVVTKNDEVTALQPFSQHPEMILKQEDVAVFLANWETKADNLLHLSEILHIGTEQMVFIDDNPFERNMVRRGVPGICVPELPEDPAEWVAFLSRLHLFDTASVSAEDADRTAQYRQEASRAVFRRSFKDEDEYLASLGMKAKVEALSEMNIPRMAQLSQRSNQFNLRTRRYTEAELKILADDKTNSVSLCFSLSDTFGHHGEVAFVLLRRTDTDTLFVDTWLMSCRVLKRGMEQFVANMMVQTAREMGITTLTAEYIPTHKNAMVANLLPLSGFKPAPVCARAKDACGKIASTAGSVPYVLRVEDYRTLPCHIFLAE